MGARLILIVTILALGWQPARADQTDPRLDDLFTRLRLAESPADAAFTETLIWNIWFRYDGDNDDIRRLMSQGMAAAQEGLLEVAEESFAQVIAQEPDFAEGWNQRATIRYMRGDYAGSIADIQAVLALEPRHFGALSGLGLCYVELGELERALAAFEATLEIHPHAPGAAANVALLEEFLAGDPI